MDSTAASYILKPKSMAKIALCSDHDIYPYKNKVLLYFHTKP